MKLSEWQNAIRTPSSYRIGNSQLRFQTKFILFLILLACIGLFIVTYPSSSPPSKYYETTVDVAPPPDEVFGGKHAAILFATKAKTKTKVYPLTAPVQTEKGLKYRIGIIADLDKASKTTGGKWMSYLRKGNLFVQFDRQDSKNSKVSIEWESSEPQVIKSGLSQDGRGMELSELISYNGEIYSCDDRTGIVFKLVERGAEIEPIPWVILVDGNGSATKGFKCEWGCTKGDDLWIGGFGKEFTNNKGEIESHDPQFVKRITAGGAVTHINWRSNYNKLLSAVNIHYPGYMIHESGGWSESLQRWMFLPRRASTEMYDDKLDEHRGTNFLIIADESFDNIELRHVGEIVPTHGFSSFKWIPGTDDQLVLALRSEEVGSTTASYVMVFDMHGHILLEETKVGDHKYEGVEFL